MCRSSRLTSVIIPDSVISIGKSAFSNCDRLTNVTIGSSVKTIGENAFDYCYRLPYIEIPNSVTTIGKNAFSSCYALVTASLGSGVTSIGSGAFNNCESLTTITVDSANQAFCSADGNLYNKDKTTLIIYPSGKADTSFTIPNSVITIDDCAFWACQNLTDITIPNSVTAIGSYAFYSCEGLTEITIPNSVTAIGDCAFYSCKGLTEITIPNSVTTIPDAAFADCINMTNASIGNGVTSIGDEAFADCVNMTNVSIGSGLTSIGLGAFYNCESLTTVTVDAANQAFCSADGNLYNKDKTTLIMYPIGKTDTSFTIPNSVTTIGEKAFYTCENLTAVTIPNSVTTIAFHAFSGCINLAAVTIPNSVTTLGYEAFSYCENLASISIGNSITTIGEYAFYECTGLTGVTIPNSVTTIDEGAFERCASLTSAKIPVSVTTIDEYAFCDVSESFIIYGSANSYAQAYADLNSIPFVVCAHSATVVLDSVAPTCTANGYTGNVCCKECGEVITPGSVIPAYGHSYTAVTVPPACTAQGYTLYTCSACGDTYKADYTAALGHNFANNAQYCANGCGTYNPNYITPTPPAQPVTIKSVKLSTSAYTYNGKAKKPSVKVVDSNGSTVSSSNYTVTYAKGRKNIGKYSVKVKFKGKFSGSKTLYFKINPKSTSLSSVKAGKKKLTVKWKKQTTQTTGYQVQYSTSKKFTGAKTTTVSKNKTTSKTVSKLKGKKKYYVRVRTYKTVGKTKYYSSWSKAKSVTTKK